MDADWIKIVDCLAPMAVESPKALQCCRAFLEMLIGNKSQAFAIGGLETNSGTNA